MGWFEWLSVVGAAASIAGVGFSIWAVIAASLAASRAKYAERLFSFHMAMKPRQKRLSEIDWVLTQALKVGVEDLRVRSPIRKCPYR